MPWPSRTYRDNCVTVRLTSATPTLILTLMDSYNEAIERELERVRDELRRTREALRNLMLRRGPEEVLVARQLLGLQERTVMAA